MGCRWGATQQGVTTSYAVEVSGGGFGGRSCRRRWRMAAQGRAEERAWGQAKKEDTERKEVDDGQPSGRRRRWFIRSSIWAAPASDGLFF
jgi:hypothetical protein